MVRMVIVKIVVIKVRTRHLQNLTITASVCDNLLDLSIVHSLSSSSETLGLVRLMSEFSLELVLEEEPTLSASEEPRAWSNHIGSEGELLAVKYECISVVIHLVLHVSALFVEHVALSHVESEVFDDGVKLLLAGRNCAL